MIQTEVPRFVVCDLDGVLGDVTPGIVHAINTEFGTAHTRENWISWDWPVEQLQQLTNMGINEALAWLFSTKHYSLTSPITSAQSVLKNWSEQGSQIAVATSRSPESRKVTLDWLASHYPFIHPASVFIRSENSVSGSGHKIAVIENVRPDLYFEDEPAMIGKLLKLWSQAQLGTLRVIDQPWNQDSQLNPFRTTWDIQSTNGVNES